ncbi:MAG: addiction module protein [Dehalococcoidia bacterium]
MTIERPVPYPDTMPSEQLTQQLLALPLPERVALAETLWQSIDEEPESDVLDEEREAVELARKRSAELDSGAVAGRTHEQVMEAARRTLQCG